MPPIDEIEASYASEPQSLTRVTRLLLWLAALFALVMALLPQPPVLPGAASDKAQHMLAFAVLSLLSALAYPQRRLGEIFIAMAVFGALIEVLQLIPALGRSADIADWIADCGASLAVLVVIGGVRWLAGQSGRASRNPV
ncbi:MAG: hypothetical protein RL268_1738 [Pseudomonadota bacterium]